MTRGTRGDDSMDELLGGLDGSERVLVTAERSLAIGGGTRPRDGLWPS